MATYQLTVGPDGRVTIPDTYPGQSLVIQVVPEATADGDGTRPIPEEEQEAIKARVKKLASEMRSKLPEPWRTADHGDLLYGDDGLPK